MIRRVLDQLVLRVANLATRGFYRKVETAGFDRLDTRRPTLIVANHFNGFADPVLVVSALGRLPRFLAKATLWKVFVVRPLLALLGVIPIHRQVDGGAGAKNRRAFEDAEAELREGGTIAVFPEGTTHDIPRLAPIRTGSARIALGAKAQGVNDIQIVPVGIWFEDKVALRSRVLVRAGVPLDLDHELWSILPDGAEATDEDHASVRALTAEITERLRAVSPDFDTFLDSAAFSWAADIALREGMERPQQAVPLAQREPLAARLARSDADERARLSGELGRYSLALDALGVTDEELVPRPTPTSLFKRALWLAVGVILLTPFAVAGFLINAVPALLVVVAGLTVKSPVTKGTVRILVAIVVFPLAWLLVAWFDVGGAVISEVLAALSFPLSPVIGVVFDNRSGFWAGLLVFVTAPLFGLCAIWILEWIVGLVRLARGWYAVYARRAQLEEVMTQRAGLVEQVRVVSAHGAKSM
ncbi:MAG TPA: 1-acyl-sn-glycerol-3-phosphate acyltransferase [Acidimicrobiales bacterium]|nr:1-acyl-sn-glycerol-3-phosphate acyltransferase [Acidimicrobiales bacterium]